MRICSNSEWSRTDYTGEHERANSGEQPCHVIIQLGNPNFLSFRWIGLNNFNIFVQMNIKLLHQFWFTGHMFCVFYLLSGYDPLSNGLVDVEPLRSPFLETVISQLLGQLIADSSQMSFSPGIVPRHGELPCPSHISSLERAYITICWRVLQSLSVLPATGATLRWLPSSDPFVQSPVGGLRPLMQLHYI